MSIQTRYKCKFYVGSYADRQRKANEDNAIAYIEHHFNSSISPTANYCCVIVGDNASKRSMDMARDYCGRVSAAYGLKNGGVKIGGYNGRGNSNVRHTSMPAMLLEPMFISNKEGYSVASSNAGQLQLARILADVLQKHFPSGGLIAFSVGHKYKPRSGDLGARGYGGTMEADMAEEVLRKAKDILEGVC